MNGTTAIGALIGLGLILWLVIYAWRHPGHWSVKVALVLLVINAISNIYEYNLITKLQSGEA